MQKLAFKFTSLVIVGFLLFFSCQKTTIISTKHLTEKVIIIVMDGARFSETWGDSSHTFTPNLSNIIASKGCAFNEFYNNGDTYTSPGHLAMLSGQYYNLNNSGTELPPFPTIFQYFNQTYPNKKSWLIASKDKLEVLANTSDTKYNNLHLANTDCGISGLGSGYRDDSITLQNSLNILANQHPDLTLINFREPDFTAHMSDSLGYLNQIKKVDSLIYELFKLTETNTNFKEKTTIFITNDHGRHNDLNGGYSNHGDNCLGCRQIMLFATGPDFKTNSVISSNYELIDIAPTIAELMCFELPNSQGKVMSELFK
ncbi:MAG: alkaline phosphatase [Vicingaceae bacterium]|nr:alkaline phosphatase [Vicingaceae bacterium]